MISKIEAGCMAIVLDGENAGKVVGVIQWLRPNHKCEYNGKWCRNNFPDGRWLVDGPNLSTTQGNFNLALAPTKSLLRIDGSFDETDADICDDLDNYFDLRKLKRGN